jgi:hypothetical protein
MTAGVLDKPEVLAKEDFAIACAIHEIAHGKAPCERPATLIIRVHSCLTTFACQECWTQLLDYMKEVERERVKNPKMAGDWSCQMCKRKAKTFDDLMWSEPL